MSELAEDLKTPIQSYGILICTDAFDHIVGISSVIENMVRQPPEDFLGRDVRDLLMRHFPDESAQILQTVRKIKHREIGIKTVEIELNREKYALRLSKVNDHVYWEWERIKLEKSVVFHMDDIAHVLESSSTFVWHNLSENILQILQFDRVYISQIHENGTSEVIAECVKDSSKSLLNGRFSKDFLIPEDLENYQTSHYKYVPDLFAPLTRFHQLADEQTNVAHSCLNPLPLLHADFARSIGVKSLIAFPLIANGRMWGIVTAHSFAGKEIEVQKRQLCHLLCMYAAKKQESHIKDSLLEFKEDINDILLNLRNDLMYNQDILKTLSEHIATIQNIPDACGVAICMADEMYTAGTVPHKTQIRQISILHHHLKKRPLFLDSNFRLRYAHLIDGELNFAGLMALRIGKDAELSMMWFRQEEIDLIYHTVPLSQQISTEEHGQQDMIYTHETWQREVVDTAKSWTTNDIYFVDQLINLLQDTMLTKSEEKDRINQKLIALNNELEMLTFTLSHDLKNPLSVVKLSSQMLAKKIKDTDQERWINMLLDGVDDIENMVNSVLSVGKSRVYDFEYTEVPMYLMIEKIVSHCQLVQNTLHTSVQYGELLPIWGDRNLLHQVFQNIIGNAVKYSKNHVSPSLHIHSYLSEDKTIYEVQDNGIGIPNNELEHIFHVFKRSSNVGKINGTGVGLALVRRIMDRLQANVNLLSSEETGTKVILAFKNKPLAD